MKSLFEELGGTYTLGKDGMYYPNLAIEETDQRSIGKWGRMHREYLKEQYPSLYERLILNRTLDGHLADANE
ncbi:MAG: TnpV protein, partial [Clostridiales bacterium]|nr:TnpV protein [Clostridiales bacterium]